MLKIAIVFPIFNGLSYTKQCLESLYKLTRVPAVLELNFSIVVVDDGSSDGSYEWIEKNYPQASLLKGDGQLWWSGGINMGVNFAIKQLHSDYILWWNNDILADDNYFMNLAHIIRNNDPKTIIGSKIYLSHNRNIVWSMGGIFNPVTGYKNMIGSERPDDSNMNKIIECDWLTGMGTITHASVYQNIGMLDEKNFPQYHGDSDFTFRAKTKGYKLIVNPNLKIFNDTNNSGLIHDDDLGNLFKSLFSIRSSYNIFKDIKFYRMHTKSILAYYPLWEKYTRYVLGFFKWKVLSIFKIERKKTKQN
ncbi:MAG: glycosyltransferase family 2 protein [Bacteroidales bacterium]